MGEESYENFEVKTKSYSPSEEEIHFPDENEKQASNTDSEENNTVAVTSLFPASNSQEQDALKNGGGIKSIATTPMFLEDLGEIPLDDDYNDAKADNVTADTIDTTVTADD